MPDNMDCVVNRLQQQWRSHSEIIQSCAEEYRAFFPENHICEDSATTFCGFITDALTNNYIECAQECLQHSEIRSFFQKAIAKNVTRDFCNCYTDACSQEYKGIFLDGLRRAGENIDYFCTHLSQGTLNNRWPNRVYCWFWNEAEKNGWDTYPLLMDMETNFCTYDKDETTGQVFYMPYGQEDQETSFNYVCRVIILACLNRRQKEELTDEENSYSIPYSSSTIQDKFSRFLSPTLTKLIHNPLDSLENPLEMPSSGRIIWSKTRSALKKAGYYDPNKDETLRDLLK